MKKVVGVLAAAVILAGIGAMHLWRELRTERREASELATRESTLKSAQQARVVTHLPSQPVAPPAPAATAEPAARQPPATATANPPLKAMLEAAASAEGQDATRAIMRGMMAQMYPDIEQELNLTPQEKEKFFDLLAKQGVSSADLMLGGGQDPAATRELQRKLVESRRTQEAELATLLGSKYPKWEEYQSTAAARQQVDQLRRTLSASGNPLSEAQSTQLISAFAAEQKRSDKETRDWSTSSAAVNSPNLLQEEMQRMSETRNRLVDVAAPLLNSSQLDLYRRQVEQQAAMLRATMGLMGGGARP